VKRVSANKDGRAHAPATTKTPGRISLREQQKQFTRARLVDAALEVFLERGYSAATVDDIATAAGASRATFYLHFEAKVEVVRELMGPPRTAAVTLFDDLGNLPEVSREGIEEWLGRAVDYWEEHRDVLTVVTEALVIEPGLATDFYSNMERLVGTMTKLVQRATGCVDEESRLRASMLYIGFERFCYFWIIRRVAFDRDLVLRMLSDMWFDELSACRDGRHGGTSTQARPAT
jgi:AcrR family transcriptional regulator